MKKALVVLLGAAVFSLGMGSDVLASDYGTITISGSATDTFVANESVVLVTNRIERDTVADAKVENDRVSAVFRESLRDIGILDKDIKTNNYTIREKETYLRDSKTYKKTFVVTNTIQVTVTDNTKTSRVIDKAAAAGISEVRLSKMDLNRKDKEALRQKLLIEAAKDARQKADALAAALGTRVVGVSSFSENSYNRTYGRSTMYDMKAVAVADSQSSVEYGEKSEDMYVSVVFKVK